MAIQKQEMVYANCDGCIRRFNNSTGGVYFLSTDSLILSLRSEGWKVQSLGEHVVIHCPSCQKEK